MKHDSNIDGFPFREGTPGWFGIGISCFEWGGRGFGVLPVHDDHPSGGCKPDAGFVLQSTTAPEGTCDGDGQGTEGGDE